MRRERGVFQNKVRALEARESPVHLRPERIPGGWLEDRERVSRER